MAIIIAIGNIIGVGINYVADIAGLVWNQVESFWESADDYWDN